MPACQSCCPNCAHPLSPQVDGLWHSSVVVDNVEFSYGPPLRRSMAGGSAMGEPDQVLDMG